MPIPGSALANNISDALANPPVKGPKGPPPTSPDVLAQLQGTSWRGISFPSMSVDMKGGHNVVVHQFMDRNGARLENTGQKYNEFTLKIPFVNGLWTGDMEDWEDPLFPTVLLQFLTAVEDRSDGPLVHPTYGSRNCKALTWGETLDPNFRGGVVLLVSFGETIADGDAATLASTSTLTIATAAANTLDDSIMTLTPPPDTGTGGISLSAFVSSIEAIGDEWNLLVMQVNAKIAQVINSLMGIAEAFGYVPGLSDATMRLVSALHAMRDKQLQQSKAVSYYVTPKYSTLPSLTTKLKTDVSTLLKLNPSLARSALIPPQTIVTYYSP
jgi:prophage DNA circulation protein